MNEAVNHPAHYGGADNPYEAIKVIEAWGLGFCLGNTVKYISRNPDATIEDLEKARWYLDREIARRRLEAATAEVTGPTWPEGIDGNGNELVDTGRASAEAAWDEGFEAARHWLSLNWSAAHSVNEGRPANPYADEPEPPKLTRSHICPFVGCSKNHVSAAMSRRAVLDHMREVHGTADLYEPIEVAPR